MDAGRAALVAASAEEVVGGPNIIAFAGSVVLQHAAITSLMHGCLSAIICIHRIALDRKKAYINCFQRHSLIGIIYITVFVPEAPC